MIPDVLHLGPIPIHIFGIFLALAFLAASAVASREFARKGYDPALGSSVVVWAAVGGIVGARLWLVLDAWPEFVRAPAGFLLNGGGFVFYGGVAGGAPAGDRLPPPARTPVAARGGHPAAADAPRAG